MTDSVHKDLTGADLHEPKGADTALAGQVYVSDGAGSGAWTAASSVITNSAWSTGDLKATHKTTADTGWIMWVEGSIGDGSSSATLRANADCSDLFVLYWNNYSDTLCPVSGGRGASAAADFAAHKKLTVPRGPGRSLGVAGAGTSLTTRTLGSYTGAETITLVTANLPPYTPAGVNGNVTVQSTIGTLLAGSIASQLVGIQGGSSFSAAIVQANTLSVQSPTSIGSGPTFNGSAQGGTSTPFSTLQPTTFINMMIKL